jgi:hypothetical protein
MRKSGKGLFSGYSKSNGSPLPKSRSLRFTVCHLSQLPTERTIGLSLPSRLNHLIQILGQFPFFWAFLRALVNDIADSGVFIKTRISPCTPSGSCLGKRDGVISVARISSRHSRQITLSFCSE